MALAGTAIEAGTIFQLGKEGTRGTAVAATNRLLIDSLSVDPGAVTHKPTPAVGTLTRQGPTSITRKLAQLKAAGPLSYEQIGYFLGMGVKGAVTAPATPPLYVYTYNPDEISDPNPDTYTIERRLSDMLASPGYDDIEMEYCFARQFTIKGAEGEEAVWQIDADIVGRQVTSTTLTGAIAVPTVEEILVLKTAVYINDTWAALGNTQITGQVLDFSLTYDTGLKELFCPDGNLFFSRYSFAGSPGRARGATLDLTMLVSTAMAAERTKAQAGATRFVQLKATGASSKEVTLGMAVQHESGDIAEVGAKDGLRIVSMKLVPLYDATGAAHFKAVVKNLLAALV
jgi:hypothetical protein